MREREMDKTQNKGRDDKAIRGEWGGSLVRSSKTMWCVWVNALYSTVPVCQNVPPTFASP